MRKVYGVLLLCCFLSVYGNGSFAADRGNGACLSSLNRPLASFNKVELFNRIPVSTKIKRLAQALILIPTLWNAPEEFAEMSAQFERGFEEARLQQKQETQRNLDASIESFHQFVIDQQIQLHLEKLNQVLLKVQGQASRRPTLGEFSYLRGKVFPKENYSVLSLAEDQELLEAWINHDSAPMKQIIKNHIIENEFETIKQDNH